MRSKRLFCQLVYDVYIYINIGNIVADIVADIEYLGNQPE